MGGETCTKDNGRDGSAGNKGKPHFNLLEWQLEFSFQARRGDRLHLERIKMPRQVMV
jgi:hypothetical protein